MKHKDVKKIMKKDEFQDFIVGMGKSFKNNMENFIIAGVIALVIIIAVPMYFSHKKNMEDKAAEIISRADFYTTRPVINDKKSSMYGAFKTKEEKYDKILKTYMEVIQSYKGTKFMPRAYIGVANAYYNSGKYKEALEYFKTFVDKNPKSDFMSEAYNGIGYSNFSMKKYAEAANAWKVIVDNYKNSENYFEAEINLANCYEKLNKKEKAKEIYKNVIDKDSELEWGDIASEKLAGIN